MTLWQALMRLDCDKKIDATGEYNANASGSEAEIKEPGLTHLRFFDVINVKNYLLMFRFKMDNFIPSILYSAVSTRNTRNSQLLNIPLFRTASDQRTFQYRATSLWNELQPALKLSPSVTEFKCLFRQKLLNDCFI